MVVGLGMNPASQVRVSFGLYRDVNVELDQIERPLLAGGLRVGDEIVLAIDFTGENGHSAHTGDRGVVVGEGKSPATQVLVRCGDFEQLNVNITQLE